MSKNIRLYHPSDEEEQQGYRDAEAVLREPVIAALKATIRANVRLGRSTREIVQACASKVPDASIEEFESLLCEVAGEETPEVEGLRRFLHERRPGPDAA